jgi:hypothetical protein
MMFYVLYRVVFIRFEHKSRWYFPFYTELSSSDLNISHDGVFSFIQGLPRLNLRLCHDGFECGFKRIAYLHAEFLVWLRFVMTKREWSWD